jgi:hypothetical protein
MSVFNFSLEPIPQQIRVSVNMGPGLTQAATQRREREHTMHTTRSNRVLPSTAAVALAIITLTAGPALADGSSGHSVVRAPLVGSMPNTSPTIALIKPGGAPWVNGPSKVRVRKDGRITVTIRRLVIPPPVGTGVNPVASVVATLVCDNKVKSSTMPFALSGAGNGSTSDVIRVPRHCDDPAVLIQPAGNRAVYIASAFGEDD